MSQTADKAISSVGMWEALGSAVAMALTLAVLALFDVAEGWRVPIILAIGIALLGAQISVAAQAICGQIWLADPLRSDE